MASEYFIPGRLKNLQVILKNADSSKEVDITALIIQVSITEDIFKNTLYGAIRIRDAADLLGGSSSGFPILGEEFIELNYTVDWQPKEVIGKKLRFAVYNISEISYLKNNTLKEYTLNICSEENIIDATTVVMKAYNDTNSNSLKSILQDYLHIDKINFPFKGKRQKELYNLQPTKGQQNVCIPRLPPLQAGQFLARRSISEQTFKSATYLFFENFNGFNFCDIEYLIKKGIEKAREGKVLDDPKNVISDFRYFFESPFIANDQVNPRERQTILKMHHRNFFDTIEKLKNGLFESDMIVYDYVNKKTITTRNRFLNNKDKTNNDSLSLGGQNEKSFPENSITFMRSVTSNNNNEIKYSRFFFIPKDNSQTNNDTFLDQIYPARAAYFTRLAQNMFTLDVYGNPNINAGDVIFIQIPEGNPEPDKQTNLNKFISGFYLVCTINHIFTQTTYQAKWDVYKNAFSSKVESTDEAKNIKTTPTDGKSIANKFDNPIDLLPPALPDIGTTISTFFDNFRTRR